MPEDIERAELQLEQFVGDSLEPASPVSAIKRLRSLGISEEVARAAIWFLLDRDRLSLTDDRKLVISDRLAQPVIG